MQSKIAIALLSVGVLGGILFAVLCFEQRKRVDTQFLSEIQVREELRRSESQCEREPGNQAACYLREQNQKQLDELQSAKAEESGRAPTFLSLAIGLPLSFGIVALVVERAQQKGIASQASNDVQSSEHQTSSIARNSFNPFVPRSSAIWLLLAALACLTLFFRDWRQEYYYHPQVVTLLIAVAIFALMVAGMTLARVGRRKVLAASVGCLVVATGCAVISIHDFGVGAPESVSFGLAAFFGLIAVLVSCVEVYSGGRVKLSKIGRAAIYALSGLGSLHVMVSVFLIFRGAAVIGIPVLALGLLLIGWTEVTKRRAAQS